MPSEEEEEGAYLRDRFRPDLVAILQRATSRPEIAGAIDEERLVREQLIQEIANDPDVLSRVSVAYQPVLDRAEHLSLHRRARPPAWQPGWRPRPRQIAGFAATVLMLVGWVLLMVTWLPGHTGWSLVWRGIVSIYFGGVVVFSTVGVFAEHGLPPTTWHWCIWVGDLIRLQFRVFERARAWRKAIQEDVILPELRERINRRRVPSYSTKFSLRDSSGLSLPSSMTPLVRTQAMGRFQRELSRMDPGAIGIAGRRGAGKTTLIERTVNQEFVPAFKPHYLTVLASAPARYDARDFVLHLYAATCRVVIDAVTPTGHRTGGHDAELWRRLVQRERGKTVAARLFRGTLWTAAGMVSGIIFTLVAWGIGPGNTGDEAATRLIAAYTDLFTAPLDSFLPWRWSYLPQLGACLLPLAGMTPLAFALVDTFLETLKAANSVRRRLKRKRRITNEGKALSALARHNLKQIRFLQTQTDGWSGKLNPLTTVSFGLTRSIAHAEQPLTHPEIVEQYRSFLDRVVDVLVHGRAISGVVVAIDELDKIDDPAHAQQFINEIKGIFGVQHCLFLVSVSEDALTSFERRGIPVRDAFDSAFNTMIHVDPFTLDESRTWLARRAIGIPEPFVCLCHCLSGGLPRDLRRTAITMHDLANEIGCDRTLGAIAHALVAQEIQAKLRAFSSAAQQQDEDASDLLTVLNTVPVTFDAGNLLVLCEKVLPDDTAAAPSPLARLRWEVACYLYFCTTVGEFFTDQLTPRQLRAACAEDGIGGTVDTLATARQHMALDPRLSWRLVSAFRESWRLNVVAAIDTPAPIAVHLRPRDRS